jgi:hypothetical protein
MKKKKGNEFDFIKIGSEDIVSLKYFGYRGRKGPLETFFLLFNFSFYFLLFLLPATICLLLSVPVSRDKMERIKAQC